MITSKNNIVHKYLSWDCSWGNKLKKCLNCEGPFILWQICFCLYEWIEQYFAENSLRVIFIFSLSNTYGKIWTVKMVEKVKSKTCENYALASCVFIN